MNISKSQINVTTADTWPDGRSLITMLGLGGMGFTYEQAIEIEGPLLALTVRAHSAGIRGTGDTWLDDKPFIELLCDIGLPYAQAVEVEHALVGIAKRAYTAGRTELEAYDEQQ